MKTYALGMLETVGYTTAVSAADAALKAAEVELLAIEKVIGAGQAISVTVHLSGDVAAITSAVEAGEKEGNRVGKVISAHVIPHAHQEVDEKLLSLFSLPKQKEAPSAKQSVTNKAKQGKRTATTKRKKADTQPVETEAIVEQKTQAESSNETNQSATE